MLAVGQEERKAMRGVQAGINLGDFSRSAAARVHLQDRGCRIGGENNHSVGAPGSAAAERRVAKRLHRAAAEFDGLQLSVGKKSERAAVGRPEGVNCAIGSGGNAVPEHSWAGAR